MEEIIREFIEWAHVTSPDAWWIYESTDEAIEKFMEQRDSDEEE
jgi:hypothetical protein